MCLCDVIVKLPVGKYYAAGRATKVLRLHVLFLEVSSHVVAALDNFPAHKTHEAISTLLHLSPHHCLEILSHIWKSPENIIFREALPKKRVQSTSEH